MGDNNGDAGALLIAHLLHLLDVDNNGGGRGGERGGRR